MKTRNLIGAGLLVAFVAGSYLGGLFPKLGGGPGIGFGGGESGASSSSQVDEAPDEGSDSPRESADNDPRVLHVRIDGKAYAIVTAKGARDSSLEQLVSQVDRHPGDDQGIRVRVSRRPNSKPSAEIKLRDALVEAGVAEEEIDWQEGPRP
ncbi:MAG: hypothetical protein ACKV0T_18695 [Planctomycetales bacterium]